MKLSHDYWRLEVEIGEREAVIYSKLCVLIIIYFTPLLYPIRPIRYILRCWLRLVLYVVSNHNTMNPIFLGLDILSLVKVCTTNVPKSLQELVQSCSNQRCNLHASPLPRGLTDSMVIQSCMPPCLQYVGSVCPAVFRATKRAQRSTGRCAEACVDGPKGHREQEHTQTGLNI